MGQIPATEKGSVSYTRDILRDSDIGQTRAEGEGIITDFGDSFRQCNGA